MVKLDEIDFMRYFGKKTDKMVYLVFLFFFYVKLVLEFMVSIILKLQIKT